jgi:hypothetical protein
MGLTVLLHGGMQISSCTCSCCGNEHTTEEKREFYNANITHNLNVMAKDAGIYMEIWRPEEINISKAEQLIVPLTKGLALLKSDPKRFKKLEPKNKWGTYKNFVPWVEAYLHACNQYPKATVEVWR